MADTEWKELYKICVYLAIIKINNAAGVIIIIIIINICSGQ